MKKILFILFSFMILKAQSLYFDAFQNIRKAKIIQKNNPEKAKQLFLEAYTNLKQISIQSIKNQTPSSNTFFLLGILYLNGWGIEKDENKGIKFLCASETYGNVRAKTALKKLNITKCKKINMKELLK